ncbi:mycolate reductase [Nocardioides marinquilinus]|uniref:Mycolate reductase n=1 Tax=Nocardioides marinquilinus TaxID=1210400 RepID=A0ABP9PHE6_9ACTN
MSLPDPQPDRTAVVTGASGGIGAEIARELARRGHGVTLVARSAGRLEAVAAELRELGVRVEVFAADLVDRSARAGLLGAVEARGLVPHVLVNNAGFSTLGPVADADPDAELSMLELDVVAVADLCVRFVPGMVARGAGAVLNVASTAAFQPLPGQAGYGAGKAFVLSYTQSLAAELKGRGVSVTCLCPGPVETGFGERAGFTTGEAKKALPEPMWVSAPDVARAAVDGLSRGRLVVVPGTVNKVAAALSQVTPRTLLLPVLARNHPGLR